MSFPPAQAHGPLELVVDGVWQVRAGFPMGPGILISRTMTVVKHPDGLVVLNAVRLSDAGQAALDELGKVAHLVRLSESHGLDEPYYVDRYKPEVWAPPGATLPEGVTAAKTLGPDSPIAGAVVIDFPGCSGWKERALWIPNGGGTLISCDVLQNHCDSQQTSFLGRVMKSVMGFKGGVIVAPMWRKMQKLQGPQLKQALSGLERVGFANLVTGHGPAVIGGADATVKTAIARAVA